MPLRHFASDAAMLLAAILPLFADFAIATAAIFDATIFAAILMPLSYFFFFFFFFFFRGARSMRQRCCAA